jgi:hypothetical protein
VPPIKRSIAWVKKDPFGVEHADVVLRDASLSASGVAIGTEPVPYRLDYRLITRRGFVTARLRIEARGESWRRRLDLRRSAADAWSIYARANGELALPPPGGSVASFADAVDCDLGLSPLTNTMPVLRHGLHKGGGPFEFTMAWVSVPDLAVRSSGQRYRFVELQGDRYIVRFEDDDGFTANIAFDADGLVLDYPGLARRLGRNESVTGASSARNG